MNWRLGVVGSPIEHSLSPALHEAGLRLAGLSGTSRRWPMDHAEAGEIHAVMQGHFDALSVTMPLKGLVGQYCDSVDDVAQRTGSVNSLLMREGRLLGASTDGAGMLDALRAEFAFDAQGANVVVLGAGGVARAIVDALVEGGVESVALHGRSASNVQTISERYANVFDFSLSLRPINLIVNTVPVHGRTPESAVLHGVDQETIALDVTYEPRLTEWRALYRHHGCPSANGLAMLAYQAARQMNWWWDVQLSGADLIEVVA